MDILELRSIDLNTVLNLNLLNISKLKYMKEYAGTIFLLQFNVMNLVHEAPESVQFVFQSVRPLKVVAFITGSGRLYLSEWIVPASGYKFHSESLPLQNHVLSYWQAGRYLCPEVVLTFTHQTFMWIKIS